MRTEPNGAAVRLIVVGAGPMGVAWVRNVRASHGAELVGLIDLDTALAERVLAEEGLAGIPVARSLSELLETVPADAVVNVTVPAAHHRVTSEALLAGLPVLTEKPIAVTVAEGWSLAALAESTGQLLMVSQSRRYYRHLVQLRNVIRGLGDIGTVTAEFFKAPHFGGFRDQMPHPLLTDMAIHTFDAYRFLLGADPESVLCEEFNPSWSWYAGDANVVASFTGSERSRFVYTGSWCSPGLETSWNGQWRVSAEHGSAIWNGSDSPEWEADIPVSPDDPGEVPEDIRGSLAEFLDALKTGAVPATAALGNLPSLAMVEAAARSSATGSRVFLQDVELDALEQAIGSETVPEAAAILRGWLDERRG